jgi:hypothetical protein
MKAIVYFPRSDNKKQGNVTLMKTKPGNSQILRICVYHVTCLVELFMFSFLQLGQTN